jgi:nucleotide-binding universal stress UspA family protein
MPRWKCILVPCDFSPCSVAAAELAAELAAEHGARLVLHHATERPSALSGTATIQPDPARGAIAVDDWLHEEARRSLGQLARAVGRDGLAVETRSDLGKPDEAILRAIRETSADLCVMGTHGRTGLAHLLVGSIAERIVRTSPVPVLTVRGPCAATAGVDDDAIEHQLDAETQG